MSGVTVFFSYSQQDELLRDNLEAHLSSLRRQGVISSWHDRRILPGDEWDHEINRNLLTADIILLLISADFINSDYCWDVEVARAIERHNAGEARVIPVILRDVDWTNTRFSSLKALPRSGNPVTSNYWSTQDQAFADVARGIAAVVRELQKENARQRYRALVVQFLVDGEISPIEQDTLDEQREELELTREEASDIQTQETRRIHARNINRERYARTFRGALEREYPISNETRIRLRNRQNGLGLTDEEVASIERPMLEERRRQEEYQQNLERYRQQFIQTPCPIDQVSRARLNRQASSWGLRAEDIERIERENDRPPNRPQRSQRIRQFLKRYWLVSIAIVVLIGVVGWFLFLRPPSTSKAIPSPTPKPTFSPEFKKRFSKGEEGENILIKAVPSQGNCKAFKLKEQKKYEEYLAAPFCKNDPEARIYLNNQRANQAINSDPQKLLNLAVVIPASSSSEKVDGAQEILRGVALAQNRFNESSNPSNRKVVVEIANEGNDEKFGRETAKEVAEYLANQDVQGVVGHSTSDTTEAAAEVYKDQKLVVISPASTAPRQSQNNPIGIKLNPYVFRTPINDLIAAQRLLAYMREKQYRKAAIVYDEGAYSQAFKKIFEKLEQNRELQLFNSESCNLSEASFDKCAGAIENYQNQNREKVDVLLLLSGTDTFTNARGFIESQNRLNLPILGGDPPYASNNLTSTAKGMVLFVSWHRSDDPRSELENQASTLLGESTINWQTAMAYDATQALIEGLSRAIEQTGCTGKFCRESLQAVLQSGQALPGGLYDEGTIAFEDGDRSITNDMKDKLGVLVKLVPNPQAKPPNKPFKFVRCRDLKCETNPEPQNP